MPIGIRLIVLILSGILFSCGGKKQEPLVDQDVDTVIMDVDTVGIPEYGEEPANDAEIFEYRSESLRNYELYIIYPFQDAVQFVMVQNGEARLLMLDEDRELEEGQALSDETFAAIKFFQESDRDGISTFEEIELSNQASANFTFRHSQTKRTQTIGSGYRFTSGNSSGDLSLTQLGDAYKFSINTTTGEHICEIESTLRIKGNIGYFEGQPYDSTCKLVFFFTDKKVQILQISSNPDCGCGANASLNQTFTLK